MIKEKLYTTHEVAELVRHSAESVYRANNLYLHLNPIKVDNRNFMWSESQVHIFSEYFASIYNGKRIDKENINRLKNLSDAICEEEHPLVTDSRFLKTSFFPSEEEITPLVFQTQKRSF